MNNDFPQPNRRQPQPPEQDPVAEVKSLTQATYQEIDNLVGKLPLTREQHLTIASTITRAFTELGNQYIGRIERMQLTFSRELSMRDARTNGFTDTDVPPLP